MHLSWHIRLMPLLFPLMLCAQEPSPDRVVVTSDAGPILYRFIACGPAIAAERCHDLEQQRLNTRVKRQWIAEAKTIYHIELNADEESHIAAEAAANRDFHMKTAALYTKLAKLALRIRQGEPQADVYADAARQGIEGGRLDEALRLLPTREAAEKELNKDLFSELQSSARAAGEEEAVRRHLAQLLEQNAPAAHISVADAEERMWSEVATRMHMRLIDTTYELPAKRHVL